MFSKKRIRYAQIGKIKVFFQKQTRNIICAQALEDRMHCFSMQVCNEQVFSPKP